MSDHHAAEHEATPAATRAAALEQVMKDAGLVTDDFIDAVVETFTERLGPKNGARVVARAWVDGDYKARLLENGRAAITELGIEGPEGDVMVVENAPRVHNVIVCTLCSCYPWSVLGLPPRWYKSPEYRARMVREPRAVLSEMGLDLAPDVEIRVWDSSAEKRYMVLPERPAGTDSLAEDALAERVTRDAMVGVALP